MSNVERLAMEFPHEQTTGTQTSDSLRNMESARNMEPTAEVIGKMSELSFQKYGGSDNPVMHQRG